MENTKVTSIKSGRKVLARNYSSVKLLKRICTYIRNNGENASATYSDSNYFVKRGLIAPVICFKGALLVKQQKVAILSQTEITELRCDISDNRNFTRIGRKDAIVDIIRVSDCPNPDDEYGRSTYTVLLEFSGLGAREIAKDRFSRTGNVLPQQANNFVLSAELPGSKPSPPVQSDAPIGKVMDSDFREASRSDTLEYPEESRTAVAVIDSGVKFNLSNLPSENLYQYTDRTGNVRKLGIIRGRALCEFDAAGVGYCSVTDYLKALPSGSSLLDVLQPLTFPQIVSSAFDDNRIEVNELDSAGKQVEHITGRHGTYITAIINQESFGMVSVLPVKAFNCGGFGTLFDLLCSLNYVLEQKKNGLNIPVLNASWVGSLDEDGRKLLFNKFEQLEKAGIIVIAAAGNQGKDLSKGEIMYPACYSTVFSNVITVTSVEPRRLPVIRKAEVVGHPNELANLEQDVLGTQVGLEGKLYRFANRGYKVVGNYSKKHVTVGVYGNRISGFNSPFNGESSIRGTSFATAYVSAQVTKYLLDKAIRPTNDRMAVLRDELLNALTQPEKSLDQTVENGRLLLVKS